MHRTHTDGKARAPLQQFLVSNAKDLERTRRVIAKAEYTEGKENPRFVVTNLPATLYEPRALYEELYCARGEMENRIKEQQLYLFADRSSCSLMNCS